LLYHILGWPEDGGELTNMGIKFGKGQYAAHAPYSKIHSDKVRIFLRRHPGDILVSWMYFLKTVGEYDKRGPFNFPELADRGMDVHKSRDKLNFLLIYAKPIIEKFIGWMGDDKVHKLRYEDLITNPEEALATVAHDLGCSLDVMVERSKFRGGRTFRAGRIGDWKDEFKKHHLVKFKRNYGEIMDAFGY